MYGMDDNKSIGVYNNKRSKINLLQLEINNYAKEVENICSAIMATAINLLSSKIPNLRYLISPVIDTGDQIRKRFYEMVLKLVKTLLVGVEMHSCILMVELKIYT